MLAMTLLADHPKEAASGLGPRAQHGGRANGELIEDQRAAGTSPFRLFQEVGHVQLVVFFEDDGPPPRGGRVEHAGRGSGVGAGT
jgi:hypothetical protein